MLCSIETLILLFQVDGIPVEVVQVSLVFRRKLMLMMIDLSIACTLSMFPTQLNTLKLVFLMMIMMMVMVVLRSGFL